MTGWLWLWLVEAAVFVVALAGWFVWCMYGPLQPGRLWCRIGIHRYRPVGHLSSGRPIIRCTHCGRTGVLI